MREVRVCASDDLPPGAGRECMIDDRLVAVFRTTDGRLFATQALCPHANGHLTEGALGARRVICPLHQWKFDLETGECVGGEPAQLAAQLAARLATYRVSERDGQLFVAIAERDS